MELTFICDATFIIHCICYFVAIVALRKGVISLKEFPWRNYKGESVKRKSLKAIPNAPWVPIMGSLPFLMGRHASRVISKWSRGRNLGTIFRVKFGPLNAVILNDYNAIKECFIKNGRLVSGRYQSPLVIELWKGKGLIFTDYGEKWKSQRQFCHSAFRKIADNEKVRKIVTEESEMMVEAMKIQLYGKNHISSDHLCGNYRRVSSNCCEERCECECNTINGTKNSQNEWKCLNPHSFVHQGNINVLCQILFGRTIVPDEENYYKVLQDTPVQFRKSSAAFMMVFLFPFLRNVPPIKGIIDEALKLRRATFVMIEHLVEEHISKFTGVTHHADLIDCYLEKIPHQEIQDSNSHFTFEQLYAVLFDVFTAGADTTPSTLLWTLLYLSRDTTLQEEIREEVNKVCSEGCHSYANMASSLHLTRATLHETARIRPIQPLGVPHKATADSEIMGFKLPEGAIVMPNVWSVHHSSEIFINPECFDPRRHLDKTGCFAPNKQVIGFSLGPRQCIGRRIAEVTMLCNLVMIMRHFEFRLPKVWSEKSCQYTQASFDFAGTEGQILMPPTFWLQWRTIS